MLWWMMRVSLPHSVTIDCLIISRGGGADWYCYLMWVFWQKRVRAGKMLKKWKRRKEGRKSRRGKHRDANVTLGEGKKPLRWRRQKEMCDGRETEKMRLPLKLVSMRILRRRSLKWWTGCGERRRKRRSTAVFLNQTWKKDSSRIFWLKMEFCLFSIWAIKTRPKLLGETAFSAKPSEKFFCFSF